MDISETQRRELVVLETTRHRVRGTLTLAREGYRSRVSDWLNAEREFFALTDVTVEPFGDEPVSTHSFLAISRRHIVFLTSDESAQ